MSHPAIASWLLHFLAPLSWFYRLGITLRLWAYHLGLFKSHRLPGRVISVGNLTVGGTGKTPCVAFLARSLTAMGAPVAILSRGYRRQSRGRVEVSDGRRVIASPAEAGDEPWLLAHLCPGVRVIADRDRFQAGSWLAAETKTTHFLLDDGYQHLQLARDLNLLLVDATESFAKVRLVPWGRFREPLSSLIRADAVIVTRSDRSFDRQALLRKLHRHLRPGVPIFFAWHELTTLLPVRPGQEGAPPVWSRADLRHRRLAAFAGIAHPEQFFADLRTAGAELVLTRAFPDHYRYRVAELEEMVRQAEIAGAEGVLLTEKDAANLPPFWAPSPALPLRQARIEFRCQEESALLDLLRKGFSC
ncbi:MAG: tetraacyldisaccharide 4'-kinase [Blastocatellia bacterium]